MSIAEQEIETSVPNKDASDTKALSPTPNLDKAIEATERNMLFDRDKFEQLQRVAHMYSSSDLVPEVYKGNVSNTAIAIQMAIRLDVDPLPFLQSSYIVHGKPGIESKLAIALLHRSGFCSTRISYCLEGKDDSRQCTASIADKTTGEVKSQTVSIEIAKAEGWYGKSGSKWKTIPDLMLQYRSAMWLIRTYYPEVIMGMLSKEELLDMRHSEMRKLPHTDQGVDLETLAADAKTKLNADLAALSKSHAKAEDIGTPNATVDMSDDIGAYPKRPKYMEGIDGDLELSWMSEGEKGIEIVMRRYEDKCNNTGQVEKVYAVVAEFKNGKE